MLKPELSQSPTPFDHLPVPTSSMGQIPAPSISGRGGIFPLSYTLSSLLLKLCFTPSLFQPFTKQAEDPEAPLTSVPYNSSRLGPVEILFLFFILLTLNTPSLQLLLEGSTEQASHLQTRILLFHSTCSQER